MNSISLKWARVCFYFIHFKPQNIRDNIRVLCIKPTLRGRLFWSLRTIFLVLQFTFNERTNSKDYNSCVSKVCKIFSKLNWNWTITHQSQGRSDCHIYGMKRSSLDLWGRMLPELHRHGECRYLCTVLVDGIWWPIQNMLPLWTEFLFVQKLFGKILQIPGF